MSKQNHFYKMISHTERMALLKKDILSKLYFPGTNERNLEISCVKYELHDSVNVRTIISVQASRISLLI